MWSKSPDKYTLHCYCNTVDTLLKLEILLKLFPTFKTRRPASTGLPLATPLMRNKYIIIHVHSFVQTFVYFTIFCVFYNRYNLVTGLSIVLCGLL